MSLFPNMRLFGLVLNTYSNHYIGKACWGSASGAWGAPLTPDGTELEEYYGRFS